MLLVLALLIMPAVIIILCQRFSALDKAGTVVLTFGTGIAVALSLDLSSLLPSMDVPSLQTTLSEVSVALALPLILFSIDIKASLHIARSTIKAMSLALVAVVSTSLIGALLFQDQVAEIWQVAGMSVGTYTGGGPNIAAISTAIGADESIFAAMLTYDLLLSSVYLLFVMSIGQRLFGLFMKPYVFADQTAESESSTNITDQKHASAMSHMADESAHAFKSLVQKSTLLSTLLAFLCSGAVVGLSVFLAGFLPEGSQGTGTIVTITTLGILMSFIPPIRKLANSFRLGMYLILVFCFTMGSMVNIEMLTNLNYAMIAYITFILVGALLIQATLCKLLGIDTDTFLITASAAIMSVPFIAVIAGALKNREIILPGLAAAILGYAVGNYLGIFVANVAKTITG